MTFDLEWAKRFVQAARQAGGYSFDVEHPPELDWSKPGFRLTGVSFATDGMAGFVRDSAVWQFIILELFPEDALEAIAYNGKYDLKCLVAVGCINSTQYPKGFCDPMVAVNLLDDNRQPNRLGLKLVVYDLFGHTMVNFEDAWAKGELSDEFADYATEDAVWEWKLGKHLRGKLKDQNLWKLFSVIVCPVSTVFADMELNGIGWDLKGARRLLWGFQKLRDEAEVKVREVVGDINLNSGDQLAKVLFEDLGFDSTGIPMTKSGKRKAVDSDAMDKLAARYPVCADIRTYRTSTKMINTYVEPLTRMALDDPHGRIHPTFWVVSATGRTRSEKPNFQNIPAWLGALFKHLSIRKNVVARPGYKLIVADLSQIELRMVAHISGDANFLKAYREWQCKVCGASGSEDVQILHRCPNCGVLENEKDGFWHGLDVHQQTTDLVKVLAGNRQHGKMCNFALVYYATAYRMHYEYPAFSVKQWEAIIEEYFAPHAYIGVRQWHVQMERLLDSCGVTTDVFGRKRRIPRADIRRHYKHALNCFINFGPQSSACALIELSLVKIAEHFRKEGVWMGDVQPSNFIHDEIVLEVREDCVPDVVPIVVDYLENSVRFKVPIRTGIEIVDRWGEAK